MLIAGGVVCLYWSEGLGKETDMDKGQFFSCGAASVIVDADGHHETSIDRLVARLTHLFAH